VAEGWHRADSRGVEQPQSGGSAALCALRPSFYMFHTIMNLTLRIVKVPVDRCDYLIDLDFPKHPIVSPLEPRYAIDDRVWERVYCMPFLDARYSSLLTRTLWLPGKTWQSKNEYGDYCLLRNRALVSSKIVQNSDKRDPEE